MHYVSGEKSTTSKTTGRGICTVRDGVEHPRKSCLHPKNMKCFPLGYLEISWLNQLRVECGVFNSIMLYNDTNYCSSAL